MSGLYINEYNIVDTYKECCLHNTSLDNGNCEHWAGCRFSIHGSASVQREDYTFPLFIYKIILIHSDEHGRISLCESCYKKHFEIYINSHDNRGIIAAMIESVLTRS